MATGRAAWLTAAKAIPFKIGPANIGVPSAGQILVKNHAIAINPIDAKMQYLGIFPLTYPTILGEDVAGEVVAVGPDVSRFKTGDRVMGFAQGFSTKKNEDKAFQTHTILSSNMACVVPTHLPYHEAVVLPLGLSTAASALFLPECLNLRVPTLPAKAPTGEVVLVWGGASSVGFNAIQLLKAAGYEVFTTASPKNFDLVKSIGASQVFDYNRQTVIDDLVAAVTKGSKTVAAVLDAVGGSAFAATTEFVRRTMGKGLIITTARGFEEYPAEGVQIKQTQSYWLDNTEAGKAIWEEFIPNALESGAYKAGPEPVVAGKGLESLQAAVDLLRKGVSAQKIVVQL